MVGDAQVPQRQYAGRWRPCCLLNSSAAEVGDAESGLRMVPSVCHAHVRSRQLLGPVDGRIPPGLWASTGSSRKIAVSIFWSKFETDGL